VLSERSYRQYCGVARALDLIGERWALLVVRELALGPKRFTDLRQGLPGIATNVLSLRLRQLERDGVVARRRLPPPAASTVYELTDHGQELVPVMLALGRWGARGLGTRKPHESLRAEWLAVALKAFFEPAAAEGLAAKVALDFGEAQYTLELADGQLEVRPGTPADADLAITTDPEGLIAFLAGAPLDLPCDGDRDLLSTMRACFPFGAPTAVMT
jgi:DNA-binding HxlR family transcriptional regulator